LKVTFVSSHSQMGGSERYLEQLIQCLGPDWVDRVICLQEGPLVERLRSNGVATEIIPAGAGPVAIFAAARRLKRSLSRHPATVVHANGVKAALVMAVAGHPRTIWVKHDFSWDGRLTRYIARRSRLVVGVSAAVLESVADSASTAVVYNGIDPVEVDETAARDRVSGLAGGGNQIVMLVGRMHPVKGHMEVIEACPQIIRTHPDVRLVFVGGADPTTPEVETALRTRVDELEIGDNVVFAGHRDDATDLMAGADVAVIPSVRLSARQGREGFPLVALEMMMAGTPIVAYASGGVPESLGECGVLVPEGNREALAAGVVSILEDDEKRRALTDCGRRRVRERFTMDTLVEGMKEHYTKVATS
jgi:glycosyltransferase involved in cell wall biosynthesis